MSTTDLTALAAHIEELFERATSDLDDDAVQTVEQVMTMLDEGEIRVAAPAGDSWNVNEWAKKAILLSFRTRGMETIEVGPYEYHDKMPLKTGILSWYSYGPTSDRKSTRSELQSHVNLVCRLLLEKKKNIKTHI